jgi:hypothetical protein
MPPGKLPLNYGHTSHCSLRCAEYSGFRIGGLYLGAVLAHRTCLLFTSVAFTHTVKVATLTPPILPHLQVSPEQAPPHRVILRLLVLMRPPLLLCWFCCTRIALPRPVPFCLPLNHCPV